MASSRHHFVQRDITGRWCVVYRGACDGLHVVGDAPSKQTAMELARELNEQAATGACASRSPRQ